MFVGDVCRLLKMTHMLQLLQINFAFVFLIDSLTNQL